VRRREFIAGVGGAAAWPIVARAQQPRKVWRIGILSGIARPDSIEKSTWGGFLQGMRELGYVQGRDFVVEYRFADGKYDLFHKLKSELIENRSDVIVVGASSGISTVQKATTTIPIVMSYSIDPVGSGLVTSLNHPGGNTTGLASAQEDIVSKHVELAVSAVPGLTRLGILTNPNAQNHLPMLESASVAAKKAALVLTRVGARTLQEIEDAFGTMLNQRVEAAVFLPDSFFNSTRHKIAELAIKARLPSIFAQRDYVDAGGLMSYGESFHEFFRRAAGFVDKIFKGAKPADLPVEQPTRFFLVLNLKTAKSLGLTVPATLLARADEVIE